MLRRIIILLLFQGNADFQGTEPFLTNIEGLPNVVGFTQTLLITVYIVFLDLLAIYWLIFLDCVLQLNVVYFPHNANDKKDDGLFCDWQGTNLIMFLIRSQKCAIMKKGKKMLSTNFTYCVILGKVQNIYMPHHEYT